MIKQFFKLVLTKLFWSGFRRILSNKQYARLRYWLEIDASLDLKEPRRFTEKIQYIKLYEHTELRRTFANRTKVRGYVADKIGEKYLIPFIGKYDQLTHDIWKSLPKKFVLKANHGSKMIKIVFNKNKEHYDSIHEQTEVWKDTNFYYYNREWAYKNLPRTIVAENLLLNASHTIPKDYKFFCFNGSVKLIQIDFDRFGHHTRNLYDENFVKIDGRLLYPPSFENADKPPHLDEAIIIAEKLAQNITFLRVDLYLLEDQIYFGELTNYPGAGYVPFEPEAIEYKIGSYLTL